MGQTEIITEKESFDSKEALKVFDPVSEGLEGLRVKYSGLKINGIEDKEGYEQVRLAKSDLVSRRTKIEPIKKKLTEDARLFVNAVNAEAKRIISEIEKIEAPISAEKARIDALIAAEKQRKIEEGLNEYNRRINLCIANGMTYMQVLIDNIQTPVYSLGKFQVKPHQIQVATPENFEKFITSVSAEYENLRIQKEETERLRVEEENRLREELKAEQERLRQEKQEFEAQKNTAEVKTWNAPEPIRSAEEATEENNYTHGIPDRARLENFATYLEFNMPPMVPNCTEEWAIPVAEKMKEQFAKMAAYIRNSYPTDNV